MSKNQRVRQGKADLNTGRWTRFYEVHENGIDWTFTAVEMWFRTACDMYLELPVFPAMKKRFLHGNSALGIEPYEQPKIIDGKPVMVGDTPYNIKLKDAHYARPGAVWMTRRLILGAYSEFFYIEPDPVLYDDMKSISNNTRDQMGGDPHDDFDGRSYHPAAHRFQRQLQPGKYNDFLPAGQRKTGALFTPHDIERMKDVLEIEPIRAEQFSFHSRRPGGRAPKSTGQYMIHPDVLDRINRPHVWDTFLERRAAFNIEEMAHKPNHRMYEWREVCDEMDRFPLFDRETILRFTADPARWGKEAATERTVDNHITKWFAAGRIRRVRYGLYQPVRQNFLEYDPFGDHFLADWFFEFLRRQAARQRVARDQTFTFEYMRDDIEKYHPDWHKFYRVSPADLTMRERLNNETVHMGKGPGDFVEKAGGKTRRISQIGLDLFAPKSMKSWMKRNGVKP